MKRRLEQRLAALCAPVLCREKAANLVGLENLKEQELHKCLEGTGIHSRILCQCERRCQVLLYDYERLEAYLNRPEHRDFLESHGYGQMGLEAALDRLAARYQEYRLGNGEFPHEIGLFLEYPLVDIQGYLMGREGKELFRGYWKVYANEEQAKATFLRYDAAKERLVEAVCQGCTLRECLSRPGMILQAAG
ncbi:MAG: DUF3793 family protein [Lachnospiraceae bacterium]|nr:DUF3793 family protein [Lachnospiraceae bacterium]